MGYNGKTGKEAVLWNSRCINVPSVATTPIPPIGNFAKIFDVQNKKFITISCQRCGYTELYRADTSTGWNVLDFLLGG